MKKKKKVQKPTDSTIAANSISIPAWHATDSVAFESGPAPWTLVVFGLSQRAIRACVGFVGWPAFFSASSV